VACLIVVAIASPIAIAVWSHAADLILTGTVYVIVMIVIALSAAIEKYDRTEIVELRPANAVTGLLVPVFVGAYVNAAVHHLWHQLVEVEQQAREDTTRDGILHRIGLVGARVWTVSIGLGIGALLAVIPFVLLTVDNTVTLEGAFRPDLALPGLFALLLVGYLLLGYHDLLLSFRRNSLRQDMPDARTVEGRSARAMVPLVLVLGAILAGAMVWQAGWHGLASVVVLAGLIVISMDTAITSLVCSSLLCMVPATRKQALIAGLAALVATEITYWGIFANSNGAVLSLAAAIVTFLAVLLARFVIVLCASAAIYSSHGSWYATDRPPAWNHIQDEGTRALLLVAIVWLPVFAYTHSDPSQALLNMLIVSGAVLFIAAGFFPWASEQMIRHYDDQRKLRFGGRFAPSSPPSGSWLTRSLSLVSGLGSPQLWRGMRDRQQLFVRALGPHLAFSVLIRLALVAATIVGLVVIAPLLIPAIIRKGKSVEVDSTGAHGV